MTKFKRKGKNKLFAKSVNAESFQPKNTVIKCKRKDKQICLHKYLKLLHMKNIKGQTISYAIRTKGFYL